MQECRLHAERKTGGDDILKKYIWGILYGFLLTVFTGYVLLDTFVITKVYQTVPQEKESTDVIEQGDNDTGSYESVSRPQESRSAVDTNNYMDDNISISISEYRTNHTTIYVADVRLSSAEYLKTAFANASYGRNVTAKTSEIAAENQAILAINGDYYGAQEKGYVLRNGVLYRDSASRNQEGLAIYNDGSFEIFEEQSVSADMLLSNGSVQILSFGPALVNNGQIAVTENDEVGKAKTSNPRTAIGIVDALHYVFVVSDGRTKESEGLSLYELAEFMQGLGVQIAYNLDGGGSSTMYFNGEIVNKPTTSGRSIKERSVSDIVYIGY